MVARVSTAARVSAGDQAAGLRRMFDARPHQLVAFAAGDDKCGRTPLVVQTAIKLAEAGERVVVIDEHRGPRRAIAKLGVGIPGDIWDSLIGRIALERLITPVVPNLWTLAADGVASRLQEDSPLIREKLDMIVTPIMGGAEFVLIDSQLSPDGGLSVLSTMAHHMVVVVGAETGSITDAYTLIKRLVHERGREGFHIVITRPKNEAAGRKVFDNLKKTAQAHLGVRLDLLAIVRTPTVENLSEELFSRLPHPLGDLR
jgi:flagellar biosynthesis protein FlhG